MIPDHAASLKLMASRLLRMADKELALVNTRDIDTAIEVAIAIDDRVDARVKLIGTPDAPLPIS